MGKKILFVEDEAVLQKTFSDLITKEGFEVISALDGEAGLRQAKAQKPDLILLDVILPKVNGFDVLKKLKEDPETKEIPVIVLTNLEAVEDVDQALKLGAKSYLVKTNYSLEELVEKINQAFC